MPKAGAGETFISHMPETQPSKSMGCVPTGYGRFTNPSRVQPRGSKTSLFHSEYESKNAGVVPRLIPTEEGGASVASMGFNSASGSGGCEVRAVVRPEAELDSAT